MKISFVGLGSMGLPMARNLVAGGFTVLGFDTRPAAVEEFDSVDDAWVMLLVAWPAAPTPTSTAQDAARIPARWPRVVFFARCAARCLALACRRASALILDMIDRLSHLRS